MKIAISGSHGSGKSFTMYELAHKYKLKYPNHEITVVTETARKSPFPINEVATIESQIWMIVTQIQKEMEAEKNNDIIITDRCLADYMAYTKIQYPDLYIRFLPYLKYHITSYDTIYFKDIYKNNYLVDDGVRSMNKEFRELVHDKLSEIYDILMPNIKKFERI